MGSLPPAVPGFESIQEKTFLRWWNSELPRAKRIKDLTKDLAAGVVGVSLLHALTGTTIPHDAAPRSRVKMMENNTLFLRALKDMGIYVADLTADDIADGNRSLILQLTWRLISFFLASRTSTSAARSAAELLDWLKANGSGYAGVHAARLGWGASLADGRALCALLHRFDATCLDFDGLPAPGSSADAAHRTVQTALDVAESAFGAPRLLDAADVAGFVSDAVGSGGGSGAAVVTVDEASMQAYLLKLRQAIGRVAAKRKAAAAEQRAAFIREVRSLCAWAAESAAQLGAHLQRSRELCKHEQGDVAEADALLTQLEAFQAQDKVRAEETREALQETRLPQLLRALNAAAAAQARYVHALPPTSSESDRVAAAAAALREVESAAEQARKEAETELLGCSADLERNWQTLEAIEAEYTQALWAVLVQKETDLLFDAAKREAIDIEACVGAWTSRLSDPASAGALHFDGRLVAAWTGPADSAAALRGSIELLGVWGGGATFATTLLDDCCCTCDMCGACEYRATFERRHESASQRVEARRASTAGRAGAAGGGGGGPHPGPTAGNNMSSKPSNRAVLAPGADPAALALRRDACLVRVEDVARRRREEGRGPAEDLAERLRVSRRPQHRSSAHMAASAIFSMSSRISTPPGGLLD